MQAVDLLRQNDPERTSITLRLDSETSDANLALALEQNPFITAINVTFIGEQTTDWGAFLRVIAARGNLVNVTLNASRYAPAALVSAILRAVQQNAAVRSVHLRFDRFPNDLSAFVDTASSITSFTLSEYAMERVEREEGTRQLAAALQRNTNIEHLELRFLKDIYAIPILQGLRFNTYLKTLVLGYVRSHQQLRTLTDSIPLMRTIKKLEIDVDGDRYVEEEDVKQLLLQAVKNNFSLRSVRAYIRSGFESNNIFNAEEKTRLVFYTDRNERLDHWVDNPEQVDDRKVWPEALKLADQAGPDSLYRGLRSVLGRNYVSLPPGRKRKHSQFSIPS